MISYNLNECHSAGRYTGDIPTSSGDHIVIRKTAVSARVPQLQHLLSEERSHAHAPFSTCLTGLCDALVALKPKLLSFFAEKSNYLVYIIRPLRLELSEMTTAAVRKLNYPKAQTKLSSFLGLCKVFHRSFSNFSKVAVTLNTQLRKGRTTTIPTVTKTKTDAAENLRTLLMNPSMTALLRATGQYTVDTDA